MNALNVKKLYLYMFIGHLLHIVRGVQPTHHISPTQPNPTHMGRVGLGWVEPMGLTIFIIIIIINKLSKKNTNINILKKPKN